MNFDLEAAELVLRQQVESCGRFQPGAEHLAAEMERLGRTGLFEAKRAGSLAWQIGLEELAAREPYLAWAAGTGVIFASALLEAFGSPRMKNTVSELRRGKTLVPCAFSEPGASWRPDGLRCVLQKEKSSFRLYGDKAPLDCFPGMKAILLAAAGEGGTYLCLLPTDRPGLHWVTREAVPGLGPIEQATLNLDGVEAGTEEIGGPWETKPVFDALHSAQRIFSCAFALGVARRALERAIALCNTRHGDEKPPAAHQLVRFALAEMRARLDAAEILCRRAAWAEDRGSLEAASLWSCARVSSAEAACELSDAAVRLAGRPALGAVGELTDLLLAARQVALLGPALSAERMAIADDVLEAVP